MRFGNIWVQDPKNIAFVTLNMTERQYYVSIITDTSTEVKTYYLDFGALEKDYRKLVNYLNKNRKEVENESA